MAKDVTHKLDILGEETNKGKLVNKILRNMMPKWNQYYIVLEEIKILKKLGYDDFFGL